MASELEKAQALIMVDLTRKGLINAIKDAQQKGVSESALMHTLHLDLGPLIRFVEENP